MLFWLGCVVATLFVGLAIAAPWILRAAVPDAFERVGLRATVTGGSLSLVRREITLQGFVLGAPETPALSLAELGLGLELRALADGRIKLRHIRVRDIDVDIERLLALRKDFDADTGQRGKGLPVELHELELADIRLASVSERIGHEVRIARLRVGDASALASERPSSVSLEGSVGEGNVDLQLEMDIDPGKLEVKGTYHVDALPLRGWARLVSAADDPISAGAVSGRGELRSEFAIDARELVLTLNGWMSLQGFAAGSGSVATQAGDADWRGRLVLGLSPDRRLPELRGDGTLDVKKLQLGIGQSSQRPMHAVMDDVSWHGRFHFLDALTAEGAVLGSDVEASDGAPDAPAWRARAQDFSWRLLVGGQTGNAAYDMLVRDFDLARFALALADDAAPVDIVAEKLALDELGAARSGHLALGRASAETLTIGRAGGAGHGAGVSVAVNAITATGLSGDPSGTLHAADANIESIEYAGAGRRVRAETIGFAGVSIGPSASFGADGLNVDSAHVDDSGTDVWLSGVRVEKARGDTDGRFAAETMEVARAFQSGSARISWEGSGLRLGGVDGDVRDAASIASVELDAVKIGIDGASWDGSGLRSRSARFTVDGDIDAARVEFDSVEGRQPGTGDVRIAGFEASGLGIRDGRTRLDRIGIATAGLRFPGGFELGMRTLDAHAVAGDGVNAIEIERLAVGGGEGRDHQGARLMATSLDARGLSVASGARIAVGEARLARFTRTMPDAAKLDLQDLDVTSLGWAPQGGVSVAAATLGSATLGGAGDRRWALSGVDGGNVVWDGEARVAARRLMLASLDQTRAGAREWQARSLQGADLELHLPGDVSVAAMSAETIDGIAAGVAWKAADVDVERVKSSPRDGQRAERLRFGAIALSDEGNGARLDIGRARVEAVELSILRELAAREAVLGSLRLASAHADWPSRLSVAELRIDAPHVGIGGIVDLGEVVARNPYLIVAHSASGDWMLPPLPGRKPDTRAHSDDGAAGGIRVARFSTRGPGRLVLIDRSTEPPARLALDPLVIAVQNLDTSLPGNRARFRARGTSSRFAGVNLHGDIIKGVQGFDLALVVGVTGVYVPELNPYVARHEPIAFTTGRGDAHGKISVESSQLSGRIDVLLSGLQLRNLVGATTLPRLAPGNLTIRTALALLKDGNGNISLSIPLRAHTGNPDFDFIEVLQSAFVDTIRTAGTVAAGVTERTLDAAVGLVESTVSVLPGVDTTRYPPIVFAAGADDITASHLEYLDQLADRMREYETLEVALCGRSVAGDRERIIAQATGGDELFARASEGVYRIYGPKIRDMVALAESRAETVRRYLRDLRGVADRRLAPCDVEYDAGSDAIPRVELEVKKPAERHGLFGLFP